MKVIEAIETNIFVGKLPEGLPFRKATYRDNNY